MKFYDYRSGFKESRDLAAQLGWKNDADAARWLLTHEDQWTADPLAFRHALFVIGWRQLQSPYYNVYPSIIKMLSSISLNFPGNLVTPPNGLTELLLRFPENHSKVHNIFFSFQQCKRSTADNEPIENGLMVGMDIGENHNGLPLYTLKMFPLDERTVEDTANILSTCPSMKRGEPVSVELIMGAIKTAIAICMIQDDPEILEPEVLNKDQGKPITDDLINKAKRRGKFGFNLGKRIEVVPHLRRAHPALVWTGPGRTMPKIIFRKGSVIHRKAIETIPTGYGDD